MNPITNIKNQNKLNEREIAMGIAGDLTKSWHQVSTIHISCVKTINGLLYNNMDANIYVTNPATLVLLLYVSGNNI